MGFNKAGLLIKHWCTKPIRGRAGTIFLYGYCISTWYWRSFAHYWDGLFRRNDFRWTTRYIWPFQLRCLPNYII